MRPVALTLTCLMLFAAAASATTFVVPDDGELIAKSAAIAIGTVEGSYVQETDGIIETVYEIRLEQSLKGLKALPPASELLRIVSPGGVLGDRAMHVEAAAHFSQGDRVLLFLTRQEGRWTTTDLTLGKFRFATSTKGAELLVRDMEDVVGWDHNGQVHHEQVRRRDEFLQFIRERMNGRAPLSDYVSDYLVDASEVTLAPEKPVQRRLTPTVNAPFSGPTYTSWVSNQPTRWSNMSAGVTFRKVASQNIPGLADGGVAAIQSGLAAWTNEGGSVINLIYGGTTATASKSFDGINVVEFNDPQNRISGSWTGSGTIGICFNSFSSSHSFGGVTWWSISDADVVFQNGYPGTHSSFPTAMTHELGHGIGWRHSNQNHMTQGACNPSVEECTSAAIMNSSVNSSFQYNLQPWDVNAAQSVYPGTGGPTCTPPSITSQPQGATIASGGSHNLSVTAGGTTPFTYQWYIGTSGNTSNPISGATGSSRTVSPTTTTSYWVRVTNACGTANSNAATVTVTQPPPPPPPPSRKGLRSDFDGDGKSEIYWYNPSTGASMIWYVNGSGVTSTANLPTTSPAWAPAGMADFNGDGRSDIFWRDNAGHNYMWLMNGSSPGGAAMAPQPASWNIAGSGDFDGDGLFDIFWHNDSTGSNMIWFMNGATVRSTATLPATGSSTVWSPQAFSDFDGDGRWDIFWRDNAGNNYMWLMNGSSPSGAAVASQPANWKLAASGDFNGDGRHDIMWNDPGNGNNRLWLMNGPSRTELSEPTTNTAYIVGVSGDFNGDRTDDVAWRRSDGVNATWLFHNGSPASTALPSQPVGWQMYGKK